MENIYKDLLEKILNTHDYFARLNYHVDQCGCWECKEIRPLLTKPLPITCPNGCDLEAYGNHNRECGLKPNESDT